MPNVREYQRWYAAGRARNKADIERDMWWSALLKSMESTMGGD